MLIFTVRPPFAVFDGVLAQMTERATRLASRLLDQFHYLHFTTSNSIEVSGHSFQRLQICDVFFSMPALLCAACVFLCVMRRRWAHAIPSLLASSVVALLMQAAMMCVTVVVWQKYGTDATLGMDRLMLGGAVFALGLLTVISLDVLLSAFNEPIPLMATSTINPLALLWNKLFLPFPETDSAEGEGTAGPELKAIMEEAPSLLGMLGPWVWDFVFSWFITRSRRRFLIGLPSVVLGIAGVHLWTNAETPEQINGRYEAALTEAMDQNQEADIELTMQRLQQSHVDTYAIRFRQAKKLISRGKKDAAIAHLQALTPLGGQGHVPARLWLVEQSEAPDALMPLDELQRQQQLRKAVQEHRLNLDAHLLLAKSYLRQRQTRLAELHFTTAAQLDPIHAPELLVLQKALGRSLQELVLHSAAAMQKLKDRLSQDPDDHQARISYARITAMLGDTRKAESLLKDGLAIEETTEVKKALSLLYTGMGIELIKKPLNQKQAADLVLQAVLLDPANTSAINLLFQAVQPTGTIDPNRLSPATDHWRQQLEQDSTSVQNRQILTQLLTVSGLFDDAIEVLKTTAAANVDSQANLARLYVLAGRMDDARGVTDALLKELKSGDSDDERVVVTMARVILIENRLQDVVELVETRFTAANRVPGAELAAIYVGSLIALFDQKAAADDSFVGTEESLELLQRVYG
ncbi:MAG: archaeosortase/exosortase family protein, partial [Planctomycetaceae bacterium]